MDRRYKAGRDHAIAGTLEWELNEKLIEDFDGDFSRADYRRALEGFKAGLRQRAVDRGVRRYTDALEAYDGFGTVTIETTQRQIKGSPIRVVSIQPDHLTWQSMRYGSGWHICMSEEEYLEAEDLFDEVES